MAKHEKSLNAENSSSKSVFSGLSLKSKILLNGNSIKEA